ncbi:MAG TPA: hypothetical protein VFE25_03505 [Opitutaceae bacterium]|jgi:hypothetical protein|nr:hypothetical protein [Opitutaceae bacterium]
MAEAVLLTLALALSLMSIPGPPGTGLDGSWQEMLVHAHTVGLQFGRDIIFTWGPWGFLCTRYHLGAQAAVPILIWQTAGQLLMAGCLVNLTWNLPAWRRVVFFACIAVLHWLFQDTVYFLLIALAGVGPLMRPGAKMPQLVFWAVFLGFLAQLKFTYFVISGAAVAVAACCQWARRSGTSAAALVAAYGLSVLGTWMAAGQSLDNLYPYIRRSLEISSGYGDAMGLDESWTAFGWGVAIAITCGAYCRHLWRNVPERCLGKASSVLLFFVLFVMWKEAFTRADFVALGGHIFGFVGLVALLVPTTCSLLLGVRRPTWPDASLVLCFLGVYFIESAYYSQVLRIEWERIYGNVRVLENLRRQPSDWEAQLGTASEAAALPAIQAEVGKATIDTYNYQEGVPILNGLTVRARPIFQSYSAYTPSLEGWNLRDYLSDRAPDYLLWNDGLVDNRYPGEDDAMLVETLPSRYEPVLSENGYWLFRKRAMAGQGRPVHKLLLKKTVHLGESVDVPAGQRQAVWIEANPVPNALGRARALLYKPAEIHILTTDETGLQRQWRLLPRVAATGFILVPTLEHGEDLAALMQGDANSRVRRFVFTAPEGEDEFWSHVDVNLLAIPSLPFAAIPASRLIGLGIVGERPLSIESVAEPVFVDVAEGKALQLHAPGEMILSIPKGSMQFSGTIGLLPGTYSDGGSTAGVEFSVDAVWSSGRSMRLWSRYLDPVAEQADRGSQRFQVNLPEDGPVRLVLRTGTGPRTDNRWDWSYVRDLRFGGTTP